MLMVTYYMEPGLEQSLAMFRVQIKHCSVQEHDQGPITDRCN